MCTVSNVGDIYSERLRPWIYPPMVPGPPRMNDVRREEFDALKREVLEMKELLKAAKRIDELAGTPDCETDEKMAILRKVAELVGVELP